MPLATGVFRPAVLLPAEARSWPDDKRRAVLLHELAQLRALGLPDAYPHAPCLRRALVPTRLRG